MCDHGGPGCERTWHDELFDGFLPGERKQPRARQPPLSPERPMGKLSPERSAENQQRLSDGDGIGHVGLGRGGISLHSLMSLKGILRKKRKKITWVPNGMRGNVPTRVPACSRPTFCTWEPTSQLQPPAGQYRTCAG